MLAALGVDGIDLLSNNPDKAAQPRAPGARVRDRIPTGVFVTIGNLHYLRAKAEHTGHSIELGNHADLLARTPLAI
ncbi:GTP cyclohydrolase II [Kitasatospora sp. MAP5-34]|nr:GTP cyclohydrolase II [Kitasatospora sp. MAP5-34]